MIFKPAWISTVQHLENFQNIITDASRAIKRGERYQIPVDFPQIRKEIFFGLMYSSPNPLIWLSNGILNVSNDDLSYKAYPLHILKGKVRNLHDLPEFSIAKNEIVALSRHDFFSPIDNSFNITFTRIFSKQKGLLQDFLVCAGIEGLEFDRSRKVSVELFDSLTKITEYKIR